MSHYVMTAVGADRTGLVNDLTRQLMTLNANLGETRMVNLRGQFALLAEIQCRAPFEEIQQQLTAIAEQLKLKLQLAPAAEPGKPAGNARAWRLQTHMMDEPGIVQRISRILCSHQANIEDLQTHLQPGAYTGTPLFSMTIVITLPAEAPIQPIRQAIDELCQQMNCEWQIDSI